MPISPKARPTIRKSPRQTRSQHTVAAILRATAQVLVARGWAKTTTNHVAARAGVSIGTLYEYFSGKEALATALAERHLDEAESRLGSLATRLAPLVQHAPVRLEPLVHEMVAAMVELHARDPRLHHVLFEEMPLPAAARRRVKEMQRAHARGLALLLSACPEVRVPDRELAARMVVLLLESCTHRWMQDAKDLPVPATRLHDELEALVVAYLRAGGAALEAHTPA